ncbi:branched-chain amino acid transport system II carrier protein [bacterium]|nr:branched-chain amino acid transport system II carrier protein [bacterium]
MKQKLSKAVVISSGLAIFSMFFGAGNLMYPIKTGIISGTNNFFGISGFLITAVLLPLFGLVAMILFNGNYKEFFGRLGAAGKPVTIICMIVIGPLVAIPRIVSVAHVMMAPFLPIKLLQGSSTGSLLAFSILFLGITFLGSFKENKIVDVLGYVISPLLVASLGVLIFMGFLSAGPTLPASAPAWNVFKLNLIRGYGTLDLLAAIFFASIVLGILKDKLGTGTAKSLKKLAYIGLKAGVIGTGLLGLVYIGQSYLGAHFGAGLSSLNEGQAFREIVFRVLGHYGAAIVGSASMLACFSTSIALGAVIAEYLQKEVFYNKVGYVASLTLVLLASMPLAIYGLDAVLKLAGGPLTYVGYPALIVLTFCNIAYKLFNFKPVKVPVLATFILALAAYFV